MAKYRSHLVGKHVSIITSSDEYYWDCYVESTFKEHDLIFYRCILENGSVNCVNLDTICNYFERKSLNFPAEKPVKKELETNKKKRESKYLTLVK